MKKKRPGYTQSIDINWVVLLGYGYNLWVEVCNDQIEIFNEFPKEFKIVKEVNQSNHPFTPKKFKEGTILYYFASGGRGYTSCNWLNGIPLWDNLDDKYELGLRPSVQINYEHISRNQ